MQVNPELAKSSGAASLPMFKSDTADNATSDKAFAEMSRVLSQSEDSSSYVLDMPDLSGSESR